jgi:hypothetical protein
MSSLFTIHKAVAAKIITMFHLDGIYNPADILSKHWDYQQNLVQPSSNSLLSR